MSGDTLLVKSTTDGVWNPSIPATSTRIACVSFTNLRLCGWRLPPALDTWVVSKSNTYISTWDSSTLCFHYHTRIAVTTLDDHWQNTRPFKLVVKHVLQSNLKKQRFPLQVTGLSPKPWARRNKPRPPKSSARAKVPAAPKRPKPHGSDWLQLGHFYVCCFSGVFCSKPQCGCCCSGAFMLMKVFLGLLWFCDKRKGTLVALDPQQLFCRPSNHQNIVPNVRRCSHPCAGATFRQIFNMPLIGKIALREWSSHQGLCFQPYHSRMLVLQAESK